MGAITTSIFDIFKIGPGPSSSQTIGPMKAGWEFLQSAKSLSAEALRAAEGIRVILYGSLAATGKGHGTGRAVLAGVLELEPETCPPGALDDLLRDPQATYGIAEHGRSHAGVCGYHLFLDRWKRRGNRPWQRNGREMGRC